MSLQNRVPCVPACQRGLRANVPACQRVSKSVPTSHFYLYVRHIKTVLYFISILHIILKKSVWNFYFFLFCSLVRNENIKRPGFYTLQVTKVFSNFLQQKQLKTIKYTCEYCDLIEL